MNARRFVLVLTLSLILLLTSGCCLLQKADSAPVQNEVYTFTGVVTSVDDFGMLMECDTDAFDEVWVSLVNCPEITPEIGERYEVAYNGEALETYPPQVTAISVTLLESAPTTTTTTTASSADPLSFTGKVTKLDEDSVLMECYDKDKFDQVWVTIRGLSVTPQVGEEYVVYYEDFMMPSLPPRITATAMERVSSTPTTAAFISKERAIEVASAYWKVQPGDRAEETGFLLSIAVFEEPTEENPRYRMALRWLVEDENGEPSHYSTLDTIYIDAVTEEVSYS